MTGQGRVTKTDGKFAYVLCVRKSACGESCVHCKICDNRGVQVLAENSIGASEGDTVSVTASTKSVLFSSFILYILPVILFIVSLILGGAVFKSEKLSLIFTAVSLAVWLIVIKFLGKKEITHTISEVIYHRD